jgi:hypothetical protein
VQNGAVSTPGGLNSTYSLYFDFTATGSLITAQFTSFSMTLYGVDGVTAFGIDGNNDAFINNGANTAIQLATNTLLSGSIAGGPGSDLAADSYSTFSSTPEGIPFFLGPQLPATFHGAFFHSMNEPGGITLLQNGVVLQGGDDTLTFTPEPSSLMLLLGGLPGVLLLRRRGLFDGDGRTRRSGRAADRYRDRHRAACGDRLRHPHVHLKHARRDLAYVLQLARNAAERDHDIAQGSVPRRRQFACDPCGESRAAAGCK